MVSEDGSRVLMVMWQALFYLSGCSALICFKQKLPDSVLLNKYAHIYFPTKTYSWNAVFYAKTWQGYLFNGIMQRLKHDMCAFLHAHIWGSCFHSPLGNWKVSFQECIAHLGGSRQVTTWHSNSVLPRLLLVPVWECNSQRSLTKHKFFGTCHRLRGLVQTGTMLKSPL